MDFKFFCIFLSIYIELMVNIRMFVETYTSIKDEIHKSKNNIIDMIVCLIISILIFSLLLSFIIDLYSFIQLTVIKIITGINIKLCKKIVDSKNIIPFCVPKTAITAETVYPIQKLLYINIPSTIGIPTTASPKNHILKISNKLSNKHFFSN